MKWWQSSPAEGSAVPRAAFQGCSRSFLVMEPALVSKAASSIPHTRAVTPRPPAIPQAVPEAPKPAAGDGPPATGATSPRAVTVPPVPAGQPGGDLLSEQPRAQTRRSPRGGDFGKPVAPRRSGSKMQRALPHETTE